MDNSAQQKETGQSARKQQRRRRIDAEITPELIQRELEEGGWATIHDVRLKGLRVEVRGSTTPRYLYRVSAIPIMDALVGLHGSIIPAQARELAHILSITTGQSQGQLDCVAAMLDHALARKQRIERKIANLQTTTREVEKRIAVLREQSDAQATHNISLLRDEERALVRLVIPNNGDLTVNDRPIAESEVVSKAQELGSLGVKSTGVYFLVRGNSVVYVGQTTNFRSRLLSHIQDRMKEFDRFSFLEISDQRYLDDVEMFFIMSFRPEYNRQVNKIPSDSMIESLKACNIHVSHKWEGAHGAQSEHRSGSGSM